MLHKYKINRVYYTSHWHVEDLVVIKTINRYLPQYRSVNYKVSYIKNGSVKTMILHDDWLKLPDAPQI